MIGHVQIPESKLTHTDTIAEVYSHCQHEVQSMRFGAASQVPKRLRLVVLRGLNRELSGENVSGENVPVIECCVRV